MRPARVKHNYTAAFIAYCKGMGLEEISTTQLIPLNALTEVFRREHWDKLQKHNNNVSLSLAKPNITETRLQMIEENRERCFKTASRLLDLTEQVTEKFAADLNLKGIQPATPSNEDEAMDETLLTAKGYKMAADTLKSLTGATATAHDLLYRALGDNDAKKEDGKAASRGSTIHVHLPAAIAQPRTRKTETIILDGETR